MNAVDTNILIYAHDDREPTKKETAKNLINGLVDGVLLWQVACEYVAATRKLAPVGYTPQHARQDIYDLRQGWQTYLPTWEVFDKSAILLNRYQLSTWDALLIAASLEAGATTLYSENFSGYRTIDGLKIVNPFVASPSR
jgi:predicted nucleic acid-binding protein